jgi:RNA polymerase sporulation-specific sigma factor
LSYAESIPLTCRNAPGTVPRASVWHIFPQGHDFSFEILMFLRASKKSRSEVYLYDPIGTDKEGNEITLIDILGTDPDAVSELVEKFFESRRLIEKLKSLSSRDRKVLELRYGLGGKRRKTQREVAKIFGISRSYVSRIEKKVINKLFQELTQNKPPV